MTSRLQQELDKQYSAVQFPWRNFDEDDTRDIESLCEYVAHYFYNLGLKDILKDIKKKINEHSSAVEAVKHLAGTEIEKAWNRGYTTGLTHILTDIQLLDWRHDYED